MLPSIFGENLFDDFFGDPFGMMPHGRDPLYGKHAKNLMRTDVRETEDTYELDVDLPGFKKDEVTLELKNGVLTIQAVKVIYPEKRGNVFDSRFQKDWFQSCDEACPAIGNFLFPLLVWNVFALLSGNRPSAFPVYLSPGR